MTKELQIDKSTHEMVVPPKGHEEQNPNLLFETNKDKDFERAKKSRTNLHEWPSREC